MQTKWKVLLITLVVGLPAFLLGPMLWPPSGGMAPTPGQLPFFIAISAVEALAFGIGIAFLIYGWKMVKMVQKDAKVQGWLLCIAIAWGLISWWPHDNMHISNGENMQRLLYIEYGFHLTLVVCAFIVAYSFFTFIRHYHSGVAR